VAYDDLTDLLAAESPYGKGDYDSLKPSIKDVIYQLKRLREDGEPLDELSCLDGPSTRFKADNPAPDATTYGQLMAGLFWYFKGQQIRVSKAFRLRYKIGNSEHNLLIGYEGSGDGM
jgi:hypothetical protein